MTQEEVLQKIKEREAQKIIKGHRSREIGAKSGIIYVLLAFFLCVIGVHNFYAGYYKKGMAQLVLTLLSPFMMFIPLLLVSLWGMGEMLLVNKSANGSSFRGNTLVIWALRVLGIGIFVYQVMTTELIL
ncbi:MAG: TM2 domain-containing protein [Alphaproteobacteria bacterium]|nr:TM2 domain-containing protein [Alphaproteobacteria bacterium]